MESPEGDSIGFVEESSCCQEEMRSGLLRIRVVARMEMRSVLLKCRVVAKVEMRSRSGDAIEVKRCARSCQVEMRSVLLKCRVVARVEMRSK